MKVIISIPGALVDWPVYGKTGAFASKDDLGIKSNLTLFHPSKHDVTIRDFDGDIENLLYFVRWVKERYFSSDGKGKVRVDYDSNVNYRKQLKKLTKKAK